MRTAGKPAVGFAVGTNLKGSCWMFGLNRRLVFGSMTMFACLISGCMNESAKPTAAGKMADGKMADGKMADGKMADGKMADGKMAGKSGSKM